jgi:hypothetical protein
MATPGQVPAKFVPWGLHPMPKWIITELENRGKEYGINPSPTETNPYSGPRTAWVRVFSNGISKLAENKEGFVLGGTEGFDESYGFTQDGKVTIGVDAFGVPHKIDSGFFYTGDGNEHADLPHRPPPSVTSLECDFMGGQNASFPSLCRKIRINWQCHSLGQLNYLEPYFLTPRISVLAEWGWNNYDTTALIDLTDKEWLYGVFSDQSYTTEMIELAKGNYDLGMGYITDYGYSINEAGGYNCFTTITNANFLIEGGSYQNASITGKDSGDPSGSVKLKDFNEFVFNDMGNLEIRRAGGGEYRAPAIRLNTSGSNLVFRPGNNPESRKVSDGKANEQKKVWIRMDMIASIINKFFSLRMLNKDSGNTGVSICQFNIENVVINAHPAIKSVSENVLLPNQFAPRFVAKSSGSLPPRRERVSSENMFVAGDMRYLNLFPSVESFIKDNQFTYEYDDLKKAINPDSTGHSFPVYQPYVPTNSQNGILPGTIPSGYWGYLSDVFIQLDFFKKLVSENDTVLKLIESLLQHISQAMCNIAQLKVTPGPVSTYYTVVDTNFTSIKTKSHASLLPDIMVGSTNSSFLKSAEMDVKLSVEMSNQMIMQSATGKDIPEGYGRGNFDPKTAKVSRFAMGDRLFDIGVYDTTGPSKLDPKNNTKFGLTRAYTKGSDFYDYVTGTGADRRRYILFEKNPDLMRSVLNDKRDKNASHIHNPIMPGTTFRFEILGLGGIMYLSQFTLSNVPNTYSNEYAVWQVSDVKHKVENKIWTTSVTAHVRPLSVL